MRRESPRSADFAVLWKCPVCGGGSFQPRFRKPTEGASTDAESFRPSAKYFGLTAGRVLTCLRCGHGSLESLPSGEAVIAAYEGAADAVSLREEEGQVETARRALRRIEKLVPPAKLVDVGCWTGSFLLAAKERGWDAVGIEPSEWAALRARARGLDVRGGEFFHHELEAGGYQVAVCCDVLEHLADPRAGVERLRDLLEPGGVLYLTLPDAGSRLARALGRRWWSVVPMHLQYFTRASLTKLLTDRGLQVISIRTHAKAFSSRYYAERLDGYSRLLGRLAVGAVTLTQVADRMVAPDFRDRMAVIAMRPA